MSEKKPVVLRTTLAPSLCPVCGKASYSMNGTHPQCSVAQADAISRAARKAASIGVVEVSHKSWSKPCPSCKHRYRLAEWSAIAVTSSLSRPRALRLSSASEKRKSKQKAQPSRGCRSRRIATFSEMRRANGRVSKTSSRKRVREMVCVRPRAMNS